MTQFFDGPVLSPLAAVLLFAWLAGCGGSQLDTNSEAAPAVAEQLAAESEPVEKAPAADAAPEALTPPSAPAAAAQPSPVVAPPADGEPTPRHQAPPLTFTARDGREITLESLRGKVVMVMFFSTDCPHCQEAARSLAPVYADLSGPGFEILGLAMNPEAEKHLEQFVASYEVRFPVGTTDRTTFSRFAQISIMSSFYYPYLVFVDRAGRVAEAHQGGERAFFADLESNVRSLARQLSEE